MEEWMLNDLLECSVCLERLDISSRVLPCQHTFCKKCLEEILTTHKELRCPECRVLVPTKIEDLPPNVLLMRILEGMKNVPRIKQHENQTTVQQQHLPQTQEGSHSTHPAVAANVIPHQPVPTDIQTQQQSQIEVSSKNPVTLHHPCAKALYDYEAQEPGDLSFKKGDIITLKKRVDANWYHGEKNSNQGYFPATYVQVLIPLPNASVPQCVALYDFKMSAEDEKDCLTFNKGAVVTVIRRVDENWAEGRLADRIGIFPISFVEMNSSAKHLMKSSMNFQPGPSRSAPALPVTNNLHNSLNLSHSLSSSTPTSTTTTSSESSPSSHSPSTVAATRVHTREKRLSLNVNQHQHQSQHHRRSADISNRNRCFTSPASPDSDLQPLVSGVSSPPPATTSSTSTFLTPPALYIALYPYKPQKADELELRKGALYTVSEKCQDGWYKGTSVRTQKVGVFPGNYVQAVRSQPHPLVNPPPPIPTTVAAVPPTTNVAVATAATPAQATVSSSRQPSQSSHPPPKLPPRALSPLSSGAGATGNVPVLSSVPAASYKSQMSSSTSSSASVPAAVVARLATTPAPAPALSPRATTLISPPPNVAIGAEAAVTGAAAAASATPSHSDKKEKDREKEKERTGVSLMKRLTSRKKSSPPLLHPFSIDNPVFEDGFISSPSRASLAPAQPAPVHVRSGSCPSQLLQAVNPERIERVERDRDHAERSHDKSRHSMGGSQRVRSNKHRPNIIPAANLSIFTRSSSAAGSHASNGDATTATAAAAAPAPSSSSGSSLRSDKDKRAKHPTPAVTERFRCITAYPPNSEYELELRVGDVVYVHKKRDDGWYKGTLQRSGKTGLFPASFVEAC